MAQGEAEGLPEGGAGVLQGVNTAGVHCSSTMEPINQFSVPSGCGHELDTPSQWAPALEGYCRDCSEKAEIANRCSTSNIQAVYAKVGIGVSLSFHKIALELKLPGSDVADAALGKRLSELVEMGALVKSDVETYSINTQHVIWKLFLGA